MLPIYVNLSWSYAIGAGIALAAAHQLRGSGGQERAAAGRYLRGVLLFTGLVFVPGELAMLRHSPEWATMQVARGLPGQIVAGLVAAQLALAAVGFLLTRALLLRGQVRWAALQVVGGYFGMFFTLVHGWDGRGYQRFYSTDRDDFAHWGETSVLEHVREWTFSDIGLATFFIGIPVVGGLLLIMGILHLGGPDSGDSGGLGMVVTGILANFAVGASLFTAIVASVLVHLFGWVVGPLIGLPFLWLIVIRRGALTTLVTTWLGLPAEGDKPAAAQPPAGDVQR